METTVTTTLTMAVGSRKTADEMAVSSSTARYNKGRYCSSGGRTMPRRKPPVRAMFPVFDWKSQRETTGTVGLTSYNSNTMGVAAPGNNGSRVCQEAHGNKGPAQLTGMDKLVPTTKRSLGRLRLLTRVS
ncbi:hypothetical protein J3459_013092 [Metarhizium acridum]|uniref:uncharacterized protein n=1 Tax=Metarhizium acridum TaxID=92637 RepID=UPI001C6B1D67|nr:hypothetical protein J3458_012311 [Metarhizium acridum]KAG8416960.1 hypothetical protein J3459_013092 [Metarhizium acridum]